MTTNSTFDPRSILHKIGVVLPVSTIDAFDAAWQKLGYPSRAEAVRDALDTFLADPDILTNPDRIGRYRAFSPDEQLVERIVYIRYDQELEAARVAKVVGSSKRAVLRSAIEEFIKRAKAGTAPRYNAEGR